MQGNYNMPPPPQGFQSQGYNPGQYPYNAAAAAYNYYNSSEYPCNQYTDPTAFGQQGQVRLRDKIKNFFRFGNPKPPVLLGPDGHPLPSNYIAPNEYNARTQKYVQDRAGIEDFIGQVEFNRSRHVPHKNLHGGEFQATAGPVAGAYGPAPFPQNTAGAFGPAQMGPGPAPYPQQASGPYNAGYMSPQRLQSQQMPPQQGFMGQQGFQEQMYQQGPMYPQQQQFSQQTAEFAPGPAPVGYSQRQGVEVREKGKTEVKNSRAGGLEERKETFKREEYVTKASKPSEDKTMSEKLQDKVADAKEWVGDKLSGTGVKETKESKLADGMAKPEVVGKDLVRTEDKNTQDIIDKGQRANH